MATLVRFPTGGVLPPPSNDENARKLPGEPVRDLGALIAWLRKTKHRNKRPGARRGFKTYEQTALDFVAFQMVESYGFPDWRGYEMAEWAYDVLRDGLPALTPARAQAWLLEQLEEEDANDPIDWRPELEEYFRRDE